MWFLSCDRDERTGRLRCAGLLPALLLVAAIAYVAILAVNAAKANRTIGMPESQRDVISIAAEGKVTAVPDIATVSVGVQTEKKTVVEAQRENTDRMNAITAKMRELGIDAKDIRTASYYIYPQHDYVDGREIARGYQVVQNAELKIRDLSKIGQVLAAAGELGANQIGGVSFTIDDPEELRQQARLKGLEAAKAKAGALAQAAGVRLGRVVGFSEDGGYQPPYYSKDMAIGGTGAAPAIEAGSQDVIVNVSVSYELLP